MRNVTVGNAIERWDTYNNPKDSLNSACNFWIECMFGLMENVILVMQIIKVI